MDEALSQQRIINYYNQTEIDYQWVLGLNRNLSLHYGYWDKNTRNMAEALQRLNEILADLGKIDSSSLVLDAGCGVGGSAIFLAKKFGCRVIGISLCERQVSLGKKYAKEQGVDDLIDFHVMDFTKTNFDDKSFDVVWAIESACYANDKKAFTQEMSRVLKKGGRLVRADGFSKRNRYIGRDHFSMRKWLDGWEVNVLETAKFFRQCLKKSNFESVIFQDVSQNVMPTSIKFFRLSYPAQVIDAVLRLLRLRTASQTRNVIAARHQYLTLKKKLWQYGIFCAKK